MKTKIPVGRTLSLLIWAGYGALLLKALSVRVMDYDMWWHLANGRVMVENGVFLREDIFSHSLFGAPWINFEWLSQVLMYLCVKHVGLNSLFLVKILASLAIVFMMGWVLKSNGARGIGLLVSLLTGFLILRPRLYERTELMSLLLMAAFVFFLSRARNLPPAMLKNIPWILFALMIVWCNLHGGFIYGLGFVFLMGLGARWSKESAEYVGMINLTLILLVVGLLINPFGPKLLVLIGQHLIQFKTGLSMIEEWAPPTIKGAPVFWALFLLSGTLLAAGLLSKRPEALFWGPAVLVFAVWGGSSVRNTALASLVMLPFTVDIISKWERMHAFRSHRHTHRLAWAAVTLLLVMQAPLLAKPLPTEKVQWSRFPVGACRFVENQNMRGKMYNTYELGGFIEWTFGPDRKVMMDGRYLFHPILVEQERINSAFFDNPAVNGWPEFLNRYGIEYAVTSYSGFTVPKGRSGTPFDLSSLNGMFPRRDWALVYWDDAALVFARREPLMKEVIDLYEYNALWPYNPDQMRFLARMGGISVEEARRELERHREEVGYTVIGEEMKKIIES